MYTIRSQRQQRETDVTIKFTWFDKTDVIAFVAGTTIVFIIFVVWF
jgi:hypothetical protein